MLAAAAAVALLALGAPGAQADILLELRFDGQAFDPKAPPDFSCFSGTLGRWVSCRVLKGGAPGAWVLERLEPGKYRLHVSMVAWAHWRKGERERALEIIREALSRYRETGAGRRLEARAGLLRAGARAGRIRAQALAARGVRFDTRASTT